MERDHPQIVDFLRRLRKEPVHKTEYVALLLNVLILKGRAMRRGDMETWSPFTPVKLYCDNQATVLTVNSAFALRNFNDRDLVQRGLVNFEILNNILFRDTLTVKAESREGRHFLRRKFPFLKEKVHLLEIPILPTYVHTSICTADHLTRGDLSVLGGVPARFHKKECKTRFGGNLDRFMEKRVPTWELFEALRFVVSRVSWWKQRLKGLTRSRWVLRSRGGRQDEKLQSDRRRFY